MVIGNGRSGATDVRSQHTENSSLPDTKLAFSCLRYARGLVREIHALTNHFLGTLGRTSFAGIFTSADPLALW